MRSINSIKNIAISISTQLIIILLGFISRKVFLDSLGTEYLGVNGVLTNVLGMLALIEGGIGASITYYLYKPLADKDKPKIIALVQLFKKAYTILAIVTFILSLLFYPFLDTILKGSESVSYIHLAYFIFVTKNIISYLNAHRVALIVADQKEYVLTRINILFHILATLLKIIVLLLTQNYLLFLLIELVINLIQAIINSRIVEKRYKYIKTRDKYFITKSEKDELIKSIKALFFHNLGTYAVFGTDNILISTFMGVVTVGLYSNYIMIIGQLGSLLTPILGGITASIGNLIASEDEDKKYSVFKMIYLINFWLYSIGAIFLYNLLEPFLNFWIGEGYLLDSLTFTVLLINFYITGMRRSIITFKQTGGIFVQDKYMPLIEATINLVVSIILLKYLGLAGIFIGTTISTLSTVFWNAPRLVYKHIFNRGVRSYFQTYLFYSIITLFSCFITTQICDALVIENGLMSLVVKGIVCLTIPNLIYLGVFYKKSEFLQIRNVLGNIFSVVKVKLGSQA
ncbi:oligosaccharide flippase family protein [Neobacillus sp. FSL H8-0543]|uniref:lipopolysaccharide biosynthesis protein n=1 Tax=Neobacillus sp. FSL H8-0543 TaxID=2954672 RepID=UPI0031594617